MKLPEVVKIKFVTVCNDIDDMALQFLEFILTMSNNENINVIL